MVAKRSARSTKVKALNQIRHLGFTAPEEIRRSLQGVAREHIAKQARPRPAAHGDPVVFATKTALRSLGRWVLALDTEKRALDSLLGELVQEVAPGLLELHGVGVDTAAALLVTAGDNPDRLRCGRPGPICAGCRPSRRRRARSPASARPRRRPPSQLSPVGCRHHPAAIRPPHPGLHGPPPGGRPIKTGNHPGPQTLCRPRGLQTAASHLKPPAAVGLAPQPADTLCGLSC